MPEGRSGCWAPLWLTFLNPTRRPTAWASASVRKFRAAAASALSIFKGEGRFTEGLPLFGWLTRTVHLFFFATAASLHKKKKRYVCCVLRALGAKRSVTAAKTSRTFFSSSSFQERDVLLRNLRVNLSAARYEGRRLAVHCASVIALLTACSYRSLRSNSQSWEAFLESAPPRGLQVHCSSSLQHIYANVILLKKLLGNLLRRKNWKR